LKYQLETAGSAALAARTSDRYIEITWLASRTDQVSSCFGSGIRSNYLLFTGGVRWLTTSHGYQAHTPFSPQSVEMPGDLFICALSPLGKGVDHLKIHDLQNVRMFPIGAIPACHPENGFR